MKEVYILNGCKAFDGESFCESPVENSDTGLCATHGKLQRDAEKRAKKDAEKLALKILKSKNQEPRKKPKPVSDKRKAQMEIYTEKRRQFLLNKWCAYHGHGCIPTTIHHQKGRIGELYLDERYWVALCMDAHEWVERNPQQAKEEGFSISRLSKEETI